MKSTVRIKNSIIFADFINQLLILSVLICHTFSKCMHPLSLSHTYIMDWRFNIAQAFKLGINDLFKIQKFISTFRGGLYHPYYMKSLTKLFHHNGSCSVFVYDI